MTKPLIDSSTPQLFSPMDVGISVLPSSLLHQAQKSGTISVLQDAATWVVLKDIEVQRQVLVLRNPQFLGSIGSNTR